MLSNMFEQCTTLNHISFPNLTTVSWTNSNKTSDLERYYHMIFDKLCEDEECDKKAEYETLLKLNDGDYRRTVLQIEYGKGLANEEE